eukprot:CAMPEP_0170566738 /NCGR_PEP_ID=MMETSP0211-20121228/80031_1 /TAXON_ID=311385 /ORGANISM="Pseudokeronopsis sp., Strain OXSARD2" /LENGTH=149 /DNA_ID=CAMNT_0010887997 /DNA_START=995 /DNA_END=1444 /DNA_ORIENTATION=+
MVNKPPSFIIGPQLNPEKRYFDLFAPTVYLKAKSSLVNSTQLEEEKKGQNPEEGMAAYKLLVFQAHKTICCMLLKEDHEFDYQFLEHLYTFLFKHLPPLSIALDNMIGKVLGKDDPIKFFYFNKMNLAIKFSNMLTKEVLNLDLILLLN